MAKYRSFWSKNTKQKHSIIEWHELQTNSKKKAVAKYKQHTKTTKQKQKKYSNYSNIAKNNKHTNNSQCKDIKTKTKK